MFLFNRSSSKAEVDALSRSQAVIRFKPDGTILDANPNFLKAMGYSLDEIKGKHHSMFVDSSYAQSSDYKRFWKVLSEGEFFSAQFKRFGKNNREIWIEASYNPVLSASGKVDYVVKYATDITDQKIKSADDEGQLNAINRVQAVIHFNLDGTILDANENFLKTMGYSLDEIRGKHHSMFADPAYAQSPAYKTFWDNLRKGQFQADEYKRFGKGGREVWIQASYNPIFDANGKPFKMIKYATDITAQKIKNADYEGQIKAIDNSYAVIHFHLDGTIVDANENFLKTMGYSLDEIKGKHHSMFADSAYAQSSEYKTFWDLLRQGKFQSDEYKRLGKGGREIWIQASYNPILDASGKPFKVVKYATDITNQMLARLESQEITEGMQSMAQAVAAATEEMTSSIREISSNMTNSTNSVADISHKIEEASGLMGSLKETAISMESVVDLVRSIAGKVNLLALNAAIEAARAGDAGKGFAVVAMEVKNLANQTSNATDDIAEKIVALQDISSRAADHSASISDAASLVNQAVSAVASAIEEQSAVTQEISGNMQRTSTCVDQLTECIRKISSK